MVSPCAAGMPTLLSPFPYQRPRIMDEDNREHEMPELEGSDASEPLSKDQNFDECTAETEQAISEGPSNAQPEEQCRPYDLRSNSTDLVIGLETERPSDDGSTEEGAMESSCAQPGRHRPKHHWNVNSTGHVIDLEGECSSSDEGSTGGASAAPSPAVKCSDGEEAPRTGSQGISTFCSVQVSGQHFARRARAVQRFYDLEEQYGSLANVPRGEIEKLKAWGQHYFLIALRRGILHLYPPGIPSDVSPESRQSSISAPPEAWTDHQENHQDTWYPEVGCSVGHEQLEEQNWPAYEVSRPDPPVGEGFQQSSDSGDDHASYGHQELDQSHGTSPQMFWQQNDIAGPASSYQGGAYPQDQSSHSAPSAWGTLAMASSDSPGSSSFPGHDLFGYQYEPPGFEADQSGDWDENAQSWGDDGLGAGFDGDQTVDSAGEEFESEQVDSDASHGDAAHHEAGERE